jgi:rubrerythrin
MDTIICDECGTAYDGEEEKRCPLCGRVNK